MSLTLPSLKSAGCELEYRSDNAHHQRILSIELGWIANGTFCYENGTFCYKNGTFCYGTCVSLSPDIFCQLFGETMSSLFWVIDKHFKIKLISIRCNNYSILTMYHRNTIVLELMKIVMVHAGVAELQLIEVGWKLISILHSIFFSGFDNEIIILFTFLCAVIGIIFFAYCCRQERQERNIHPTLEAAVTEFRRAFSGGTESEESQCSASGDRPLALRRFGDDRTCPICFAQASFAVVTNCGHLFCCNCIYGYWQYSASLITPVKCAVCREIVNLLIPLPTESERENSADEALRCNERLTDYNRRFSNDARPIIDYIRDLPVLVPYMFRVIVSVNGLMFMFRIRVFLCLFGMAVYILSPFDILPEAVFGILEIRKS
ncbi:E3 ubiquitin-protein ligase [Dirofilaria immitis]